MIEKKKKNSNVKWANSNPQVYPVYVSKNQDQKIFS